MMYFMVFPILRLPHPKAKIDCLSSNNGPCFPTTHCPTFLCSPHTWALVSTNGPIVFLHRLVVLLQSPQEPPIAPNSISLFALRILNKLRNGQQQREKWRAHSRATQSFALCRQSREATSVPECLVWRSSSKSAPLISQQKLLSDSNSRCSRHYPNNHWPAYLSFDQ